MRRKYTVLLTIQTTYPNRLLQPDLRFLKRILALWTLWTLLFPLCYSACV